MRNFELEVFFSEWEFKAKHHMTASDFESLSTADLLAMGSDEDRAGFNDLWLGYTETWGAPDLRVEIARTYETMQAENILCLAGAGEGLYAAARVLLGPDDHAIVPVPNYQGAETIPLTICDVTGVAMQRSEGGNSAEWSLDIDAVKSAIRPNTKLISLNFPHNPTGMLMARDDLDALIALAQLHGIYILSDEVYRGVELNEADQMPQIADIYERGLSLNVMSKAYGLPGLRVGWLASPDKDVLQRIERYKHYLSICNSGPSERLSVIGLKNRKQIIGRNKEILRRNLTNAQKLFDDFPGLVEFRTPMGGCVAFPKYTGPGGVEAFCKKMLEESGIIVLPSSIYSSEVGDVPPDHFRIGLGRDQGVGEGLAAMRQHFERNYADFAR
ncbi:MAG: aminotransferase class I/II-fold pyridoxal phosphate-dependent enzyme [Aliishimia sp.]